MKEVANMEATATRTHKPIRADGLQSDELVTLKECIAGVRAGKKEYFVLLTNRKQTNSKKRMPGEHYAANPALAPHAHRGWLVAAPTNKKGLVYLHIYDEARAKEKGERFGHTRVTLQGLRSFEVEHDPRSYQPITRPGPLGQPQPVPTPQPATVPMPDPQALMGQAMILMGQAMVIQAQGRQGT